MNFIRTTFLFMMGLVGIAPLANANSQHVREAIEIALPGFEKKTMQADGPIQDILFSGSKLVVLGKHNLWFWDTVNNDLQKLPLQKKAKGVYKLRHLGTDGLNLYAASSDTLYQVDLKTKKTLRYPSPFKGKGLSLGFAGELDHMWWLHTEGFLRIDRYGKTLIPTLKPAALDRKDLLYFDAKKRQLWMGRKSKLLLVDFSSKPIVAREVLNTKNYLRGISGIQNGPLVVHTFHSILRLDQQGNVKQPIPVEGTRKLLKADLSANTHHFLFSDRLLEVFHLPARSVSQYRLPIEHAKGLKKVRFQGKLCAILQNGQVRLFNLPQGPKKN